jgi:hypothetical protein
MSPGSKSLEISTRRLAQERNLRTNFIVIPMSAAATAELQIDIRAGLSEPYRPFGATQFDESQVILEHFDHCFEIAVVDAIGDVIELHDEILLPATSPPGVAVPNAPQSKGLKPDYSHIGGSKRPSRQ